MTTWKQFNASEPELAARALAILTSTTNGVLGTIRRDGTPRLSGIDPFIAHGELWIGSMPGARKGADLKRDPRMALHGIPWESRKVRDGAAEPGEGDAKLTGRAVLASDEEKRAAFAAERGFEPPDIDTSDVFRIDLATVVVVSVADDQLVIDRWSAAEGRQTVRRT
ncbi:MAG: pyridoxamine 5'-phosphate oxidase family protein [Acidimicrobiia bacterium]|nr:pyridoxamine 5'-phosphate oxidase family protein [Acidimicrobiia bacterium]